MDFFGILMSMEYILNLPATTVLPWVWLGVLIVCIIIEVCTFSLTTLWAAIASLPMIFIAMTPVSFFRQILIFILITAAMLVSVRPLVLKKLKLGKFNTNINAAPGDKVTVTRTITKNKPGEVKTQNGIILKAKTADGQAFKNGSVCSIKTIKNNIIFVEK